MNKPKLKTVTKEFELELDGQTVIVLLKERIEALYDVDARTVDLLLNGKCLSVTDKFVASWVKIEGVSET